MAVAWGALYGSVLRCRAVTCTVDGNQKEQCCMHKRVLQKHLQATFGWTAIRATQAATAPKAIQRKDNPNKDDEDPTKIPARIRENTHIPMPASCARTAWYCFADNPHGPVTSSVWSSRSPIATVSCTVPSSTALCSYRPHRHTAHHGYRARGARSLGFRPSQFGSSVNVVGPRICTMCE